MDRHFKRCNFELNTLTVPYPVNVILCIWHLETNVYWGPKRFNVKKEAPSLRRSGPKHLIFYRAAGPEAQNSFYRAAARKATP